MSLAFFTFFLMWRIVDTVMQILYGGLTMALVKYWNVQLQPDRHHDFSTAGVRPALIANQTSIFDEITRLLRVSDVEYVDSSHVVFMPILHTFQFFKLLRKKFNLSTF